MKTHSVKFFSIPAALSLLAAWSVAMLQASAESALLAKVRAGDDVKIVMLGTSLTDGGSWPGALQTWLSGESPGPGTVTVVNLAVGGTASGHGVSTQTPAALLENPDAVFIEFSINDAATVTNTTKQQSEDNLNWMIDQFVAQNPNVIIVLQTMNCLPPDTSPFSPRVDLNGYYQIYRDVAAQRGAILVDHYPNWLDIYTNDFATWETYMRDPVHPSALGEANVLTPELQRVLEADPDETAPTLTSIVDDKSGGPISTNTLVTYTVTFSEDMNWTSVDAGDFSNAGSSDITIGGISEVSPGIFTVEVTPTTLGDLQLQINAGAALSDTAGNALVTTAAIPDDTTLLVNSTNAVPTWLSDPINETVATEDIAYASTLADDASDSDGNPLTFAKVSGPSWLTVAPGGVLGGTPTNDDVGANSFTVSVSDGLAAPLQATLNISVSNVNDPPAFGSDPFSAADANQDTPYSGSIAGAASDPDGDGLTYAKVDGPGWLSIASNGTLSGTPTFDDLGANSFTVSVSDGSAPPVEGSLQITVLSPPPPVLASWDAWADGSASGDADSVETGFTATANSESINRALSPYGSNDGTFGTVAGAGSADTLGVLLRFNGPKVLTLTLTNNTGSAYSIESLHFDYKRRASSPDEIVITYVSGGLGPAGTVIDTVSGLPYDGTYVSGAVDYPDFDFNLAPALTDTQLANGESAVFTLTFNGGSGNSSGVLDNVAFLGSPAGTTGNTAPNWLSDPVNETGATQDSPYGSTLSDDAEDADSDVLVFSKVSGPTWLSVGTDGSLSGTPGNDDVGPNAFTVSVSDGSASVQATLNISVANVNDPPAFAADPFSAADATVDAAYSVSIAGSASDPDDDGLTFAKVDGPGWLSVDPSGALSGTPGAVNVGDNVFTASVSDGIAAPVEATLHINVNAEEPPPQAGGVITPVGATSTSTVGGDRTIDKAIDASGLSDVSDPSSVLDDSHAYDTTAYWLSASTAVSSGTEELTFDLGGAFNVDKVHYWTYERDGDRNLRTFDISFSTDGGGTFSTPVSAASLNMADWAIGGSARAPSFVRTATFDSLSGVTHIRFSNLQNHGDTQYFALYEIRFGIAAGTTSDYSAWSGGAPANSDANGDGVPNAVAYALGAADVNESMIDRLPTFDNSDPNNFVFTFNRSEVAEVDATTTITVEYGSNLSGWTTAVHGAGGVGVDDSGASVDGLTPVIVTIPKSLAVGGKLFARINVEVGP